MSQLAGSLAPMPSGRPDWKRIGLLAGLIAFIALCGVAMLILLGFNIGPVAVAVGVIAAIIPVPLLVAAFFWLDRYEPEPIKYLAFCLAWGACVATLVAFLLNNLASWAFGRLGWPTALVAVAVAPVIEESMKALGPILLFWRRRRAFSGIVDGIVYCGLSATGFAMVENILYLGGYGYASGADKGGVAGGLAGVLGLFLARILLSGFAHPLFTSMTGVGLGISARARSRTARRLAPFAGLLAAMIMHSSWNLMITIAQDTGQYLVQLYGYFSVMMPIFLGMVGLALYLRSREGRLTERILPEYVRAGWLTAPEVATLVTMGRRMSARAWAKRVAGEEGERAMRGYQFAATQLALLRDGLQRGLAMRPEELTGMLTEERRLLECVAWYRGVFSRDPHAPPVTWDGGRYHVSFPDGSVRAVEAPQVPVVPLPVVLPRYPQSGYR
ncbi:PrsW family intramembrane metalloprotease [Rugosimonospora acidiphila]|uniref:PrsW family intramembrane metalloprotease n=1 Tax=Rugosimonospora acidiphila TaxID=556531 RepID=A0ABP9RI84_9ACTN